MKTTRTPLKETDLKGNDESYAMEKRILEVLSWYRPGATKYAIEQLEKVEMDVTAVQEIKCPDSGNIRINKSVVFYSGSKDGKKKFGIGFVVRKDLITNVLQFEPINERMCYLRLKTK
ncbi:hypothetical protein HHI36_008839 [Cryptolaemus montrouzieri]|uniref:Uncharacterized protein n=1 Tax=Cryptolaemus montrouzieri TaxID=559131 RepID=A0ABD2MUA7_9CUCU